MARKGHDASDPDPATEPESNASSAAAASPQINTPTCFNCDHDATHIIWRDGHGYTPICKMCYGAYEIIHHGEYTDSVRENHADLRMTDCIARFCPRCDATPAAKTVGVSPDHDAITLECHACDAFMELDKELVNSIIADDDRDPGDAV